MASDRSRSRSRGRREPDIAADVEAFLRAEPEIEERAATMLRTKPPEVQKIVVARGGLQGTRNPTAVLVSRIRNAEEGLRPVLDTERAGEEIERFLVIERIEAHAAARLRRAAKGVQLSVVQRGSLAGTRDPTAVLMTRIRDAEKDQAPGADDQLAVVQQVAAAAAAAESAASMQWYGTDPQAYALAYYAQMQQMYPQAVQQAAQPQTGVPSLQLVAGADGQTQLTGPDGQAMQVTAVYPHSSLAAFGAQGALGYAQLAALYGQQAAPAAAPDAGSLANLIPITDGSAADGALSADSLSQLTLSQLTQLTAATAPQGGFGATAAGLPGGMSAFLQPGLMAAGALGGGLPGGFAGGYPGASGGLGLPAGLPMGALQQQQTALATPGMFPGFSGGVPGMTAMPQLSQAGPQLML